jgi:hypothetical protein
LRIEELFWRESGRHQERQRVLKIRVGKRIENGFRKEGDKFEEFSSGSPGGKILGVRVWNY